MDYVERVGANLRQPVLIHHGSEDLVVPIRQGVELAEENLSMVSHVEVFGAGHTESYDVDFDGYVDTVLGFIEGT